MPIPVVLVSDKMQLNYRYELLEPEGLNFDAEFRPQLTPPELLRLGIFGGKYMTDCRDEFPGEWFTGAKLSPDRRDPSFNFFGVNASQPLSVWRVKGWIYLDDPRGWFQWYCRYYRGRRTADDDRQIRRWQAMRATLGKSSATAREATSSAVDVSDKRCSIGPMIADCSKWSRSPPAERYVRAGARHGGSD